MSSINSTHISPSPPGPSLGRSLAAVIDLPYRWLERAAQRRQLRALDPRVRHDLAVSSADIEREAGKAFWQA
jgi:uncharacterized protein YjiS (DUF1127 family)